MANVNGNAITRKAPRRRSQGALILHRFKKNKLAMFGVALLTVLLFICMGAPLFADYEDHAITQDVYNKNSPPNSGHILGTDQLGRDIFARLIYGGRISIIVGVVTVSLAATTGTVIGSIAAYFGDRIDNIIMRIMDVFLAIPSMLMAITIVAVLGPNIVNMVISMAFSSTPRFTRIVRSAILQVRGNEYVEAARACGTSSFRIITKHVIPNGIGPIIVQASLNVGQTILTVASLSYIGLGVQSPVPEWGTMLSEARSVMRQFPLQIIIPGIAIMLTVMSINLIGDGLRDAFDPKTKN